MLKENNIFLKGSYALIIIGFICLLTGRAYLILSLPAAILTIKRIKFGYYYLIAFSVIFILSGVAAIFRGDFGMAILSILQVIPAILILKDKKTKEWFTI